MGALGWRETDNIFFWVWGEGGSIVWMSAACETCQKVTARGPAHASKAGDEAAGLMDRRLAEN